MANKYQDLVRPQAEFDFHDYGRLTHSEILDLADQFITESKAKGLKRVAIVTGQGIHSSDGPVIKPLVSDLLRNHPDVAEYFEGKFAQGGQGVLIARLK